jgi:hypothetical protein
VATAHDDQSWLAHRDCASWSSRPTQPSSDTSLNRRFSWMMFSRCPPYRFSHLIAFFAF